MKKGKLLRVFGLTLLVILVVLSSVSAGYLYLQKNKNLKKISELVVQVSEEKAKNNEKTTKIVIYGDTRTNHEIHRKITDAIYDISPLAIFNVGDVVEDGTKPEEWVVFNQIAQKLIKSTNYYVAIGNHEKDSPHYYNNFELPGNEQWYSVNYQGIHFAVLNSNKDYKQGSEQYKWLENDLANVDAKIKHKMIIMHHPLYNTGDHYKDGAAFREVLEPLFKKHKVTAAFAGHDHDYEHSLAGGIHYFVVGGGGAPLYEQEIKLPESKKFLKSYNYSVLEIAGNNLVLKVYDENSKLLDEIDLLK